MRPPGRMKSVIKKPGGKKQPDLVEKNNQPFGRKDFEHLWTRVPLTVLCDERLTHSDVSVFAAVAYFVWQGRFVTSRFRTSLRLPAVIGPGRWRHSSGFANPAT